MPLASKVTAHQEVVFGVLGNDHWSHVFRRGLDGESRAVVVPARLS
jgi:hypothetical protein